MRLTFLLVLLALPLGLSAHGSGASLEAVSNGKRIDIGYDPVTLTAGERAVFDFELYKEATDDDAEYDRAWVRLEGDRDSFLATGIGKSSIGPTTLLLKLPNPSPPTLKLHVRYEKSGTSVAESSFELPVQPARTSGIPSDLLAAIGGALIGGALVASIHFIRHRRRA